MVANMASIMADIGDRSAPAADGACRRAGPSRICIGISSLETFTCSRPRTQHGPAMATDDEISEAAFRKLRRPGVVWFRKLVEAATGEWWWWRWRSAAKG